MSEQQTDQTDATQPDEELLDEEVAEQPDPDEGGDDPQPQVDPNAEPEWATELGRKIETVINSQNRNRKNPSPQNEAGEDKAVSKLMKFIEQEDIDIDAVPALKTLANEVLSQKRQSGETQAQYDARLHRLEQANAQLQEQLARSQFDAQHPELKGQYDDLVKEASKSLSRSYEIAAQSNDPAVWAMFEEQWRDRWQATVEKARAKIKPADTGGKTPTKKKPTGTTPVHSRSGQAQATPSGGRSVADILFGNFGKDTS